MLSLQNMAALRFPMYIGMPPIIPRVKEHYDSMVRVGAVTFNWLCTLIRPAALATTRSTASRT